MSSLFAEPDSPVLYYDQDDDEEPQLDGLRNLSVSTDGTVETLASLDENPTPPHSPTPIVHITPPGAPYTSTDHSSFVDFDRVRDEEEGEDKMTQMPNRPLRPIPPTLSIPRPGTPFFPSTFSTTVSYSDIPPTPPAVRLAFPSLPSARDLPARGETLAARRAAAGKLPNKALLSLQQMRFEASDDAGMGLGVGPGSAGIDGMEGISPAGAHPPPGFAFQLAMAFDSDSDGTVEREDRFGSGRKRSKSPLLAAPGVENVAMRRSSSTGCLRRSRSRSPLRSSIRPQSMHLDAPGSPRASAPASPRCPSSPVVKRSSAFSYSTTGPLTPLTPSHVPGAPSLGGSSSSFEWFSYAAPDSPCSRPDSPARAGFDRSYPPTLPLTPTSDSGSITPTTSKAFSINPSHVLHHVGHQRSVPRSPLGRGRFDDAATRSERGLAGENPFFA
ncbi:hypothetical protein JCM10212_004674 [Sporobolomyces blumeae]